MRFADSLKFVKFANFIIHFYTFAKFELSIYGRWEVTWPARHTAVSWLGGRDVIKMADLYSW